MRRIGAQNIPKDLNRKIQKNMVPADSRVVTVTALAASSAFPPIWAAMLKELTAGMTLMPGTVIATGTPAGVGMGFDPPEFLKPGDVVECTVEGIGTLRNTVK